MTTTLNATTSNGLVATPDNSGAIALQNNGVTGFTLDASGYPLTPLRPSFCAYANTTSGYTDSPLKYDATVNNVGGGYSTSTYRFTAPVAGTYFFSYSIWTNDSSVTR